MIYFRRIHSAAISIHSLDLQMVGRTVSTIVPDFMYLEYKSLYLELKPSVAARSVIAPYQTDATKCGPPGAARSVIAPYQTAATKCGPPSAARSVIAPYQTAAAQRRRNSRRGSGLKGKRTERMVEQLAEFTAWLRGNPINERDPARTVGARASLFWRLREKTFKRDALRVGERRGFGSEKTLASAFRNSKA